MFPRITVFGAGRSSAVLIRWLARQAASGSISICVADSDRAALALRCGPYPEIEQVVLDETDLSMRRSLVAQSGIVISLLPPAMHTEIAADCLLSGAHLLTASYADERLKSMSGEAASKGLAFLCELGLDPGIDHMSAMALFHRLRSEGRRIMSFQSHCGGLVAPESDDNAWHYKISWNPRNVVMAGSAGARFLEDGNTVSLSYREIFSSCRRVDIPGLAEMHAYPNRDSLPYLDLYGLQGADTFIRTTLRYPSFCRGWQRVIDTGLTNDETLLDTDTLSPAAFLERLIKLPAESEWMRQLETLGLGDQEPLMLGMQTSAFVLQHLLTKNMSLAPSDRDMIVMQHEIGYMEGEKMRLLRSSLVLEGEDDVHTAMAKTVGLPLGIAAILLFSRKISERGVHIPIVPGIYLPVIRELEKEGIRFTEAIV